MQLTSKIMLNINVELNNKKRGITSNIIVNINVDSPVDVAVNVVFTMDENNKTTSKLM